MHNLGYTFRRLPEVKTVRNDSFMLVRQNGEDVKIKLQDLYRDLYRQYIDEMCISSMAYREKEDYAKLDHDHDCYSNTAYTQTQYSQKDAIARLYGSQQETIYVPKYPDKTAEYTEAARRKYQTKVGVFRIFGNNPGDINVNSPSFDGWVYADGSKYNLDEFELKDDLRIAFPVDSQNQFQVPNLNGFVQFNPNKLAANENYNYAVNAGQNSVPTHDHAVTINENDNTVISQELSPSQFSPNRILHILHSSNDSNSNAPSKPHHGQNDVSFPVIPEINVDFANNVELTGITTNSYGTAFNSGNASTESYPAHNIVPGMIYIGRKI